VRLHVELSGAGEWQRLDSSMHPQSASLTGGLGAAFAVFCFAVALAIPAALPEPWPASVAPVPTDTGNTVNRASKGDQLRIIVRPPEGEPFEVKGPGTSRPKLLDGCESGFSPMDQSAAAKRAQSCTT
jgi:hypothetical protein